MKKLCKIAILTNVVPNYREGFYKILFERSDYEITIFCQENIPGLNLITIHKKFPINVHLVKHISLEKEKLVWQFLPFKKIFCEYDIIFVDGNPRNLSHFLFATFLRIFQKNVIIWSMVHSYKNNTFTESIRILWLKFFNSHFLYNDSDILQLRKRGFTNKTLVAMNNGLDQKKIDSEILKWNLNKLNEWKSINNFKNKLLILSSGRLVNNKYNTMMDALPYILEKYPNIVWCIIGSGPDFNFLKNKAIEKKVDSNVVFLGEIFDESELAPFFLSSEIFIHPFAIGLSIMHAFGYGLPIITHNNPKKHGPEFIAFLEGVTGKSYIEDDYKSLADVAINLLDDKVSINVMKANTQKLVREKYNVEIMAQRFFELVSYFNK